MKLPALAVEFLAIAVRGVAPLAADVGHQPHPVDAIAVVEAVRLYGSIPTLKTGRKFNVEIRIPLSGAIQGNLEDPPLFDSLIVCHWNGCHFVIDLLFLLWCVTVLLTFSLRRAPEAELLRKCEIVHLKLACLTRAVIHGG